MATIGLDQLPTITEAPRKARVFTSVMSLTVLP